MDIVLMDIIEKIAKSENLRKETVRLIVQNSFDGVRQALSTLAHVKYTFPHFGTFTLRRNRLSAKSINEVK